MSGPDVPAFSEAIARVLAAEGGYSNDPLDAGGETMFGITARIARAFGYSGAMRDMTREQAREVYRARFWTAQQLEQVAALSREVALELFDTGVNMGTGAAGRMLQRSLNVLNLGGGFYAEVAVDGRIGAMSVAALREYLSRRGAEGEKVLLCALSSLQGAAYIELAEQRPSDERFVYGWLRQRVMR